MKTVSRVLDIFRIRYDYIPVKRKLDREFGCIQWTRSASVFNLYGNRPKKTALSVTFIPVFKDK